LISEYSKQAVNFLKSAEKEANHKNLEEARKCLKENPIQHDSKVVEGYNEELFRIRVEIIEYYTR